jgi:transposase
MKPSPDAIPFERYVGLDLHKHYVVVAGVNQRQEVILSPKRIEIAELAGWARSNLRQTDAVVVEATTNTWTTYDLLAPLVGRCVVANPLHVKWIANARTKTDNQDVLKLAHLLAADLVPEVWVPPLQVRELRGLVAHRRGLITTQTRVKNHLQSVLHRYYLEAPSGRAFAQKNRSWWEGLSLSTTERLCVRQDLRSLDHVAEQLNDVDEELRRLSTIAPREEDVPYLVQLPGFGLLTAMTVLAAIGDVSRFPTAKHLVGYAGLGAGVHDSGLTHQGKGITKTGRRELRRVLVEAAWSAVNTHPYWKREFQRLSRRKDPNQAVVAIARKLLVAVWYVLSERVSDKHAVPDMVAFKLMVWSWKLNDEERGGLTSRQFIRYHLMRLQLGADLTHILTGKNTKRLIAPPEEVLAVKPELRIG